MSAISCTRWTAFVTRLGILDTLKVNAPQIHEDENARNDEIS